MEVGDRGEVSDNVQKHAVVARNDEHDNVTTLLHLMVVTHVRDPRTKINHATLSPVPVSTR